MLPIFLLLVVLDSVIALPQDSQHVLNGIIDSNKYEGRLQRYVFNESVDPFRLLDIVQENDLDMWQLTSSHIDIYTPPRPSTYKTYHPFQDFAKLSSTNIISSNGYTLLSQQSSATSSWNITSLQNTTFHDQYHPLHEIDNFMQDLAYLYPGYVQLENLGHSAEGREMFALKISKSESELVKKKRKERTGQLEKPGFAIIGTQHAREWIATASALYITQALVSDEGGPGSLSSLLNHFDFHIVAVPNPDGYVYTWEKDRFWYKNRMILGPYETCTGLDMNRNWGYKWSPSTTTLELQTKKKSRPPADPCSHWYPGRRPFEAPEVNNVANYITRTPGLVGFLDLRSYGQMLSAPFSYSCSVLPADAEDLLEAALGAVHSIKKHHGATFVHGRLCATLYSAPGNILDWMYGEAGIKYSYAAHLPDTGTYGYTLPSDWIRPVGEQTATMIESLAGFIAKKLKMS